ncbi:MAG: hypothetical protein V4737_18045, partial [Curtobacterium sp.]
AVQQTSSFLGAVVFDQYLRRRANQVYVGYFVGATAFSFIVFACAGSGAPPVIGAFAALVLTAGCLVALPLLIYSTVEWETTRAPTAGRQSARRCSGTPGATAASPQRPSTRSPSGWSPETTVPST